MRLQRANTSKAEKISDRTFRFVISDESVDRYHSSIKVDGWQLENYSNNGVVAFQHNTFSDNPDMIVGKGRVWVEGTTLMGEVELDPEGTNPIADKLAVKLNFGSINATSVGFNPFKWSLGDPEKGEDAAVLYFRSQDLLEWSIVTIPANPNATKESDFEGFVKMAFEDRPKLPPTKEEEKPETKAADEYTGKLLQLRVDTLKTL